MQKAFLILGCMILIILVGTGCSNNKISNSNIKINTQNEELKLRKPQEERREENKRIEVKDLAPRIYVNANNKGMGVGGLKIPYMLSSAIHEDVEKNILKVNSGNKIELKFEDKPKVLAVKISEKGILLNGQNLKERSFKAPKEIGSYLIETEVEFETGKFYYPFKIEVTNENQMIKKLHDVDFSKIIKLGIIEVLWDKKLGKTNEKPEKTFDKTKDNVVADFIMLMDKAKINEKILLDRTTANYKLKIYFQDGTWMNAYYWLNCKEYNLNIENVHGEITLDGEKMDKLLMNALLK